MHVLNGKRITLAAIAACFLFTAFIDVADARSRSGGRSFKSPSQASRPAPQRQTIAPSKPPSGSPFMRGLAGGIMGGFLGSLLFGGMAHGMGMGGLGGSGIGLFEILLLAGLGYAAFRMFAKKKALAGMGNQSAPPAAGFYPDPGFRGSADPESDPLVMGVREIWDIYPAFDPEGFKEKAQDLFFKVQAGWTRRDTAVLAPYVGDQLLDEYDRHFREMRQQGLVNRLENIAVRNVELIHAGVQDNEMFLTVRFLANLLDYTVDEASGRVTAGDPETSVKFEEEWTFAAPAGNNPSWKLEGIGS